MPFVSWPPDAGGDEHGDGRGGGDGIARLELYPLIAPAQPYRARWRAFIRKRFSDPTALMA